MLCGHLKRNAPFLFAWRYPSFLGNPTMRYNQLGNSGLFVSELCLGTMTFGAGTGFWKNIGQVGGAEAEALIGRAIERGVNFIDTADVYSDGDSEKITGQALKNLNVKRSDVVVA